MSAVVFDIQKFCLHDGPGIRTTVFFKGCNLRCKWCANPESWSATPEMLGDKLVGKAYSADEIVAEALKDRQFYEKSGGGVTFSGGEALLHGDFVVEVCEKLHDIGVNTALETAASVDNTVFSKVVKHIDYILIDVKHYDPDKLKQATGADFSKVYENLAYALALEKSVTIRIPLIPDYNDSDDDARRFISLANEVGAKVVHILPFHQFGEKKYSQLGKSYEYDGVAAIKQDAAEKYLQHFVQAGFAAQIGG